MSDTVTVALISTTGAIVIAMIPVLVGLRRANHRIDEGRRENREQHDHNNHEFSRQIGELAGGMRVMHEDVKHIGERLDDHVRHHKKARTKPTMEPARKVPAKTAATTKTRAK